MSKALDKLPDAEQKKIKKAATDRLKDWLVGADFAQDEVEKMDRETLMETWAQVRRRQWRIQNQTLGVREILI